MTNKAILIFLVIIFFISAISIIFNESISIMSNSVEMFFKNHIPQIIPIVNNNSSNWHTNSSADSLTSPNIAGEITSNPVNLSQITRISKFRSCFGHDFSGFDFEGIKESDRSMKHYFDVLPSLAGNDKVQIFAPFNGKIIFDDPNLDYPRGHQMVLVPENDTSVGVEIFHINPLDNIKSGENVKSGELIGYAAVPGGSDFDIAFGTISPVQFFDTPMSSTWDSIFNHMTPQVLSQYTENNVNVSELIISKSVRDAMPCNYPYVNGKSQVGGPYLNAPWNWVNVTQSTH